MKVIRTNLIVLIWWSYLFVNNIMIIKVLLTKNFSKKKERKMQHKKDPCLCPFRSLRNHPNSYVKNK